MALPRLPGAFGLFASSLLVVIAGARGADGSCNATCRRDIVRCMATQCDGIGREACRRRCKPAAIRTLAYVVTECREDAAGMWVGGQALRIRRGDEDPITVVEFSPGNPMPNPTPGLCRAFGGNRWGGASVAAGALQRLGVSPDGSGVVFEVNDEFSISPSPVRSLSTEQKGFFFVRSDGRGLRRLGPPSRDRTFRRFGFTFVPPIRFSPNRRRIAFTDLGPGPSGEEAVQIVVLDLATDERTQVTHLPSGIPPSNVFDDFFLTCCPAFVDNDTVLFRTFVDPDGSNPEHNFAAFTVRIDGSGLKPLPMPIAVPGSHVIPTFGVTGRRINILRMSLPGTPVSPPTTPPTPFPITEVFRQDGRNLVQLTNFKRVDTFPVFRDVAGRRAFFLASVDPPSGTNPYGNCQLFSIGMLGSGLRQVTHFLNRGSRNTIPGCFSTGFNRPDACGIGYGYYRVVFQDPVTKAVVFDSTCDPLAANPSGASQLFALRPDGSGLRQLTDAAGFTENPDGSIRVELPGPFAYSAPIH